MSSASLSTPRAAADARLSWLFSRRSDFWLASGGASLAILGAVALVHWYGDRELDVVDLVLSEFHLGATYGVIAQRRAWRDRPVDVLLVPLLILALAYLLSLRGHTVLLTSIAMYAAVWHRGRQSFGIARFYQRGMGGPVSRTHQILFRGAIYLPMLAAMLAYTHWAPAQYEGEPYFALRLGTAVTLAFGVAAFVSVMAYVGFVLKLGSGSWLRIVTPLANNDIHPGEWWVVLGHAAAFASAYVLGASNASFILVLAVFHEVQYVSFTYAMTRRLVVNHTSAQSQPSEVTTLASYLVWPMISYTGMTAGGLLKLGWLAPLGIGGLFCHYWLDARIWTKPSQR